ncbi:MAG: 50S ribosomal protein L4 [Patescibacteria group bacterium]
MKAKLYTGKGVFKKEVAIPKSFDSKASKSLLDQTIRVFEDNTHFGLNKVKTRSEVNLTKKKLYKQKGTGGARHGAKSAHIFVGGGVAHGPTGMKRKLNLPTKMKKTALLLSFAKKFNDGRAVLVEGLNKVKKTNEASKIVEAVKKTLGLKTKVVLVLTTKDMKLAKVYRNIKDLTVKEFSSLNAFTVLSASMLMMDSNCFEIKEVKVTKKVAKKSIK